LISGCTYTLKPAGYSTLPALLDAMDKNNPPINSMKALASVSIKVNNSGGEFPEGIIMSNRAMRLETLNIFYQPMLIIVYNDMVAVMDVNTGACSISSSSLLQQYTHMDVDPVIFEKLITARLIGKPEKMVTTDRGSVLQGRMEQGDWSSELSDDLSLLSTTIGYRNGDAVVCTYKEYNAVDGVRLPMRVTCTWGKNRLAIHYRRAGINVPVDPSLMDTHRLCGHE
jgi:hypothetical protein